MDFARYTVYSNMVSGPNACTQNSSNLFYQNLNQKINNMQSKVFTKFSRMTSITYKKHPKSDPIPQVAKSLS